MFAKGIIYQIFTLLLLGVYAICLSPNSFHNHNHDHNHKLYCEDFFVKNLDEDTICSHTSHLKPSKVICEICNYFNGQETIVLKTISHQIAICYTLDNIPISEMLFLQDNTNYLNKSPPFKA